MSEKRILEEARRLKPEMKKLVQTIGKNPELAYQEFKSQKLLMTYLKKHGFKVKSGVGGIKTAFMATLSHGKGPHVGYLAEYDALPKIGHACGHNLIGPASATAAISLIKGIRDFRGTVSVVGCPAEAGGGGKVLLAKKGIFKPLTVAMMVHPDNRTEVIKKMLSLIEVDIEFIGRTAHAAAAPEKGIHALNAAVATYVEIDKFSKTLRRDARVNGIFTSAGDKPNIIPDHAALKYYVRALDMPYTQMMVQKMEKIARRSAKKIGARLKIAFNPLAYEPFHPNRTLANIFKHKLKQLRVKNEQQSETKGIGSSDVGNVGQRVPTLHPMIKICDGAVCHTPQFTEAALSNKALDQMLKGAQALALTGYEVLTSPTWVKKIKQEFNK